MKLTLPHLQTRHRDQHASQTLQAASDELEHIDELLAESATIAATQLTIIRRRAAQIRP